MYKMCKLSGSAVSTSMVKVVLEGKARRLSGPKCRLRTRAAVESEARAVGRPVPLTLTSGGGLKPCLVRRPLHPYLVEQLSRNAKRHPRLSAEHGHRLMTLAGHQRVSQFPMPDLVRGHRRSRVAHITQLIRYHLVLSEETDERADGNLAQLARNIDEMVGAPRRDEPVHWRTCEACFAWVSCELIAPEVPARQLTAVSTARPVASWRSAEVACHRTRCTNATRSSFGASTNPRLSGEESSSDTRRR